MATIGCQPSVSALNTPQPYWRGLIRQLIALGALDVDTAGHGGLFLVQDKARPILRGEARVMLREEGKRRTEVLRPERPAVVKAAGPGGAEPVRGVACLARGGGEGAAHSALCDLPRHGAARYRGGAAQRASRSSVRSRAWVHRSCSATERPCWIFS